MVKSNFSIGDRVVCEIRRSWKRGVITQLAFDHYGEPSRICVVYENWLGMGREEWVYSGSLYSTEPKSGAVQKRALEGESKVSNGICNEYVAGELDRLINFGERLAKRAPCEPANAGIWLILDQMRQRVRELRGTAAREQASSGGGNELASPISAAAKGVEVVDAQ